MNRVLTVATVFSFISHSHVNLIVKGPTNAQSKRHPRRGLCPMSHPSRFSILLLARSEIGILDPSSGLIRRYRWRCRRHPDDCYPAPIQDTGRVPAASLTSWRTCRPHRTPARSPASTPSRSPLWRRRSARSPWAAGFFRSVRSAWRRDRAPGREKLGSGWRSTCGGTPTGSTGPRNRAPRPSVGHTPNPEHRTCCICWWKI